MWHIEGTRQFERSYLKLSTQIQDRVDDAVARLGRSKDPFWAFSNIGKKLADLHLSWETCKRYDLGKPKAKFGAYEKMAFDKKQEGKKQVVDHTTLKINCIVVFDNIPHTDYKVNIRIPLEWAIDRYKVHTDKESVIINDATKIDDEPIDIVPLIERLVYVGVESDRLVAQLPEEFEPENWEPKKTGMDGFLS